LCENPDLASLTARLILLIAITRPLAVIDDELELGIFAPRLGLAGEDDQVFLTRKKKKRKEKRGHAADSEGPLGLCKSAAGSEIFLSFSHVV